MTTALVKDELVEVEDFLAAEPGEKSQIKNFHVVLIALYNPNSFPVHILGSLLRSKGFKVSYVSFKVNVTNGMAMPTKKEYDMLMKLVADLKPDLIGLTLMSAFAEVAKDLTKKMRSLGVPIAWGGAHAVDSSDDSIEHADIVCVGEGEIPLLKLAYALSRGEDYKDIKSLWFNDNGVIVKNELFPLIQNLDLLPFPQFEDDDKYFIDNNELSLGETYYKDSLSWYNVMTGRGCPYLCTFCSNSFLNEKFKDLGSILRRRTVDNVIEELVIAKDRFPKLSRISANDEVFVLEKNWLREFADKYQKHVGISFHCDLYPTRVTEEVMALLNKCNLKTVTIGVQSGSERMRTDVYKRRTPDAMFLNAGNLFNKYKVFPSYDFIFDNPLETNEDLEATLNFVLQLPRPFQINAYSMQHHPSTSLTESLLSKGMILPDEVDGFSLKGMEHWHVNLEQHEKKSDLFHMYALFKIYSGSFHLFLPYFNKSFNTCPDWFFKLLIKNRATLKENPNILSFLMFYVNSAHMMGRFLSIVLSGNWRKFFKVVARIVNKKLNRSSPDRDQSIEQNQIPC